MRRCRFPARLCLQRRGAEKGIGKSVPLHLSQREAFRGLFSRADPGRASSILPEPFNSPSLQIFNFPPAFREIRTPYLQAQSFAREGRIFGARKREAVSSVTGLPSSLLANRKCLGVLRIINAGYFLGAEQASLRLWEHGAWPGSKCHPNRARWQRGIPHRAPAIKWQKKNPQTYRPLLKPNQRFQRQLCSHKSRHFRSCRGGGQALDGGQAGALSRGHSATCRLPADTTAATTIAPAPWSQRLCPPVHREDKCPPPSLDLSRGRPIKGCYFRSPALSKTARQNKWKGFCRKS